MKITNICILGGGTAGFMTAAVLSQYVKNCNLDIKVKCVYSSKIGIIGVGESTQLAINDIFQFLRLRDSDWMSKCNATYKTNVRFESWCNPGESFYYPFGDLTGDDLSPFFILQELFPDQIDKTHFARYARDHSRFAELNRLTDKGWDFDELTAYHFDTHLLSKVLYDVCTDNGVEFVDDEYLSSHQNSRGIEYIECKNTGHHYADLFVDCTGFKSLLLGGEMGVPFVPYSKTLINNRVVTAKLEYTNKEEQLKNYTNNVTMDNGWCWEIPLWDGLSVGYVHSLKFTTEEQIEEEFVKRYGVSPSRVVDFKTGRREKAWVKNVTSVGLSFGFIEPLEATGLASIITNIFRLLEVFSANHKINSFDRELFNSSVINELDGQKTFIDIHYSSAQRSDTDYWYHVTNEIEYDWDFGNCKRSVDATIGDRDYSDKKLNGGVPFILVGNEYTPMSSGFVKSLGDKKYYEDALNDWIEYDSKSNQTVLDQPTTYQYLKDNVY